MLTENAALDSDMTVTERRDDAEAILYISPPWPDPDAPDNRVRARDLGKVFVFDQMDRPVVWAPGAYASLRRSRATSATTGGFYIQEHQRHPDGVSPQLEAARIVRPDLLWSFAGSVGNHPIRRAIVSLATTPDSLALDTQRFNDTIRWGWKGAYRQEAKEAFAKYATTIGRALFVICPRGVGAGSVRLFEAMQAGRCPVVLSDDWTPPSVLDWETCCIQVAERDVALLPQLLANRAHEAASLGAAAREAWKTFFSPERQLATLLRICASVDGSIRGRLGLAATRGGVDILAHLTRVVTHKVVGWRDEA